MIVNVKKLLHRDQHDRLNQVLSSALGALGGVKNLRVTDPTMTSLNVQWDAADGAVRLYKVFYVPSAGGQEEMVRSFCSAAVMPPPDQEFLTRFSSGCVHRSRFLQESPPPS